MVPDKSGAIAAFFPNDAVNSCLSIWTDTNSSFRNKGLDFFHRQLNRLGYHFNGHFHHNQISRNFCLALNSAFCLASAHPFGDDTG